MNFEESIIVGFERMAAWAELLDRINVYPVADGDTGRNLLITLSPLRMIENKRQNTIQKILLSARGNSGNIAASFFSQFLMAESPAHLSLVVQKANNAAWSAIPEPRSGTMLTLFESLDSFLKITDSSEPASYAQELLTFLQKAVQETPEYLPRLKDAGVVDSGALGMFLFFEGLLAALSDNDELLLSPVQRFGSMLQVNSAFNEEIDEGYCVDMVLQVKDGAVDIAENIAKLGESVVMYPEKDFIKVHFHTDDYQETRKIASSLGTVMRWSVDDLGSQIREFKTASGIKDFHLFTDAAGSVTRDNAQQLGFTLLDSYVLAGDRSMPETLFPEQELYELMANGVRVSTSQASVYERHQHYQKLLQMYDRVLYLCVGSVYTGNFNVIMEWKEANDPEGRIQVIDTGSASGRLGLAVLATARYATVKADFEDVCRFAERAVSDCREYLFLDRLHFLAAGGRMSRTGAFFGDMLNIKPVVSPTPQGAQKMGVVRKNDEQLPFALEKMKETLEKGSSPLIMLQYTDNRERVETEIMPVIQKAYPDAEFIFQPLSLTTGVHTGPGTWGVSFLPESFKSFLH